LLELNLLEIIGYVVVGIGLVFMVIGVIGIYKFNGFYEKILVSSKIDTVGIITIIFGLILVNGFNMFSLRLLLLLAIVLLLGPLCTHIIARSAYLSKKENQPKGEEL